VDSVLDSIKKEKKKRQSRTYLMINRLSGYVKIGKSENPKYRESTLQSKEPQIDLIAIFKKDLEKELHELFKSKRVRGEWFDLNSQEIDYIKQKYTI
tara:strand:+ start:3330 stop:3620 length:291 start_codon:yes stop_codon:yes gene_type:complete